MVRSSFHVADRARARPAGTLMLMVAGLLLTACAAATPERAGQRTAPEAPATQPNTSVDEVDPELINPRVTDFEAPSPVRLLGLDSIAPIYEPRFAAAADARLDDKELIIGIELEGEAKAYPITVLRFREMVNDELAGLPILVTW